MPSFAKSSQGLIDLFAESLPDDPRVERRKMFGYPSIFVGGNMAAGLFEDLIFARLPEPERQALEAAHGPLPFAPMPGRPMKAYTRLPDDVIADEGRLADLLAQAVRFTAEMPAKEKKPRKAKAS